MKFQKRLIAVLVIALIVITTAFIFANSFMDFEASHNLSGFIFKIFFGNNSGQPTWDDFLLRKAAHLVEYALLGGAVIFLTLFWRKKYDKNIFVFSAIYVVLVAAADEYIQSLSDRSGTITDVFLDLSGAGLGFLLVWSINEIKKKKASS